MKKVTHDKAAYYAVTAVEQVSWYDQSGTQRHGMGWYAVAGPCASREEAKVQGEEKIGPIFNESSMGDIYRETAHKNMCVVSKSQLKTYRLDPEKIGLEIG